MIKIVTDSVSDLPPEVVRDLDITVIPMNVHFGKEAYKDRVELTAEEFYRKLEKSTVLPKTSAPGPGVFADVFDELAEKYSGILGIFLSEADLSEENQTFIRELVEGTVRNRDDIDGNIQKYAPAWPVEQIAMVDRNILRLAIFEILFDNKVPVKVAVSEAVELAKTFGSGNSAKFVNGVLGAVSTLASR